MRGRSLTEVLEEVTAEGHEPMIRFVTALSERPWVGQLRFDLSMLRLWLAEPNSSHVQVMVTYGDSRGGGMPLSAALDRYDLTFFHGSQPGATRSQTLTETLDRIGAWVASGDSSGVERRFSKQLLLNQDQASAFVASIEDQAVSNAVNAVLGNAWLLVIPHETLDGHPVAPLTPAQPVDLLFVAKLLAEVFCRKQTMIDILSGRRNPEDELL